MAKPRSIPRKTTSDPVEAPPKRAARASPLSVYKAKRNFGSTPEPRGRKAKASGFRFVVQKHDATRLHYDLRLELDGVLKSWAVTRGPSLVPGEKRLAVHTEDHPLDYLNFEGVIPKGEYGGGTMIVWDRGTWAPEGNPREDYAKGRLTFELEGERLSGRWHLVRTRPRGGKEQWLLMKSDDPAARSSSDPDILEEHTTSVVSGRTNAELVSGGKTRVDHARRQAVAGQSGRKAPTRLDALEGVRKGILPPFVEPCLASLVDTPPSGSEWLHEIKFDGYRVQARIDGGRVKLLTRSGLDWTERFGGLAERIRHLAIPSALIDGELVVEDGNGVSSFSSLQAELKAGRSERLVFYAFDLLYVNGRDLRGVQLRDRKRVLEALLDDLPADGSIRLSQHLDADGESMVRHACRMGLEGIVSKRADAPYRSGRGGDWLKAKCTDRQEFVIAGYVPATVTKQAIGSLVLGLWEGPTFHHVGRVGTGFRLNLRSSLRLS
jgi:bifunctional non-homologous end joining protein LigD